jgi:hypothetical protein
MLFNAFFMAGEIFHISYCFLNQVIDKCFTGTASRISGVTFKVLAQEVNYEDLCYECECKFALIKTKVKSLQEYFTINFPGSISKAVSSVYEVLKQSLKYIDVFLGFRTAQDSLF